ncbi:hypothetical protein [Vitiosangium sp. GDMCC 1.1324]|uniref:hypothetical protein n=1 Tax=Vitiosangium sp. (strain GDMCC 1.1324) TaxID=2138576 RepID=UPI000D36F22E|nr:hypothetical protein [Vitiosangium sp. GDMCC 1.1324]PTL78985.1 hypothetical protein DAT35_35780 [Vitiosangium sp. GDMCC 1.1324]
MMRTVWLGFVFEAAVLGFLLLMSFGFNLTTAFLLFVLPYTLNRIFTLKRLLKLQAENKAPTAAG